MSEVPSTVRVCEPGFGVYIHWPFCAQKCPYCDFNSHVRFGGWDEARFLAAYKRELDAVAEMTGAREVRSIFFGGGTPSLMKPATVAAILDHIAKLWTVDAGAEISLEANPGSVEAGRFKGYRAAGVNRVSMGLQSLRDEELRKLGRIHTVDEAKAALKIARETFERFSFDLIYARPGQSAESWRAELSEALALAGDHISLYQLTIEPDTPYAALHAAGKLVIPDDSAARDLYQVTQEMTEARGLLAYEISNHATRGEESRHNLLYWRYGEYAGVGPGAHGRVLQGGSRLATVVERNPEAWCDLTERQGHGFIEQTALTRSEEADEMLLMGLRLREGVDLGRLAALGGVTPSAQAIADLRALGLIETAWANEALSSDPGNWRANELEAIPACLGPGLAPEADSTKSASLPRLRATPQGRFVLNAVVAKLAASFHHVSPTGSASHMDNASNAQ
jgi:oxygen-independent coproporphyrinogen-3 oxidase